MPYDLSRDIQTCRGHHAVLRAQLERFPAPAVANAAQIRTALREFETVLLRHLAFEEMRLYPVLEAAAPVIADRARRYREEMGDLSGGFVAFLRRWSAEHAIEAEPQAFTQAWTAVRIALERRMTAEDDDLYEIAENASG